MSKHESMRSVTHRQHGIEFFRYSCPPPTHVVTPRRATLVRPTHHVSAPRQRHQHLPRCRGHDTESRSRKHSRSQGSRSGSRSRSRSGSRAHLFDIVLWVGLLAHGVEARLDLHPPPRHVSAAAVNGTRAAIVGSSACIDAGSAVHP
eukprot:1185248-Rhodomonas_salina.5